MHLKKDFDVSIFSCSLFVVVFGVVAFVVVEKFKRSCCGGKEVRSAVCGSQLWKSTPRLVENSARGGPKKEDPFWKVLSVPALLRKARLT